MSFKYNPLSFLGLDLVGGGGVPVFATFASFPAASSVPAGTVYMAADTQTLYSSDGATWTAIASPGDVLGVGSFSSTPTNEGLVISGSSLSLTQADATHPGGVPNIGSANGVAPLDGSGKVPVSYLPAATFIYQGLWNPNTNTPTLVDGTGVSGYTYWVSAAKAGAVSGLNNSSMVNFQIGDLVMYNGSEWQLTTPAAGVQSVNGSTGAVTVNAINQLSGDVTTSAASGSQSLASTVAFVGGKSAASIATVVNNTSGTNTGDITLAAVDTSPNANGASLSGQQLTLQPADGTHPGVLSTTTQTIAGVKTFSSAPNLSSLTASQAVVTDSSKNLASLSYVSAATNSTIVSRDVNGNSYFVNVNGSSTATVTSGQTITMNAGSAQIQKATGSSTITYKLPNATNLINGNLYYFNNNSTGLMTIQDASAGAITTVPGGGFAVVICTDNTTTAGVWDYHFNLPSNSSWGTSALSIGGTVSASNLSGTNTGDQTITLTGDVTGSGTGSFATTIANSAVTNAKIANSTIDLTTKVTGALPLANGGTGQATASAGFNALSPITTVGDLIIGDGTNSNTRLAIGSNNFVLTSNGTTASWQANAAANTALSNLASTAINADLLPGVTGTINLGSSSKTYAAFYLTGYIRDLAGLPAMQVGSSVRQLYDTSGVGSMDFQARQLYNSSGNLTVDYQAKHLVNGSSVTILDWSGSTAALGQGASITGTTKLNSLTATTVPYIDASNNLVSSAVTPTELGYVSGVTSSIQTQLGNKLSYTANNHGVLVSSATNAVTVLAPDSSTTKVLKSGGASADPSWLAYDNANTVSTLVFRDSSGNFSAGTITASLTGTASGNLAKATGDIDPTNFSIANNQASAADVTSFAFANANVRSFTALVSVYINATASLYEAFIITGIQRGADWQISVTSTGDASGVSFSITNAGQIQYVSSSYSGFVSGTMKFRAISTAT